MSGRPRRRLSALTAVVLTASALAADLGARQAGGPPSLHRLRDYLDAYEPRLGELIADERFDQREKYGIHDLRRLLLSEVGFLRLPGNLEWIGQRRVQSVDGRAVRAAAAPLADELSRPSDPKRALQIAAQNASFSLGRPRSINVPTLPLDLLSRRSAAALTFERVSQRRLDGRLVEQISLREPGSGALVVSGPRRFARVAIEAMVDPASGALLSARVDMQLPEEHATHRVEVDYRHDAALDMLVPTELRETFGSVRGTARYTNYRRFRTSARIVPDARYPD